MTDIDMIDDIEILDDFETETFNQTADMEPIVFEQKNVEPGLVVEQKEVVSFDKFEVESPTIEFSADTTIYDDFNLEENKEVVTPVIMTPIIKKPVIKTLEDEFREKNPVVDPVSAATSKTMELLNTAELLDPSVTFAPNQIEETEVMEDLGVDPEIHGKKGMILVGVAFSLLVAFIVALPHLSTLM